MVQPFPAGMRVEEIETDGAVIHTRVGGQGPAVVMLHGFGDTGDMWAPLAGALVERPHASSCPICAAWACRPIPRAATTRKPRARTSARVLDRLGIDEAELVTHDIGNMVGYAFAAQYPARVTRWVVMDAPLPGIGSWDELLKSPALWHFNFRGPDVERLVQGRERIYLDRFWNELSATPARDRRGDAPALCRALRAARRHALRRSSSSRPSPRTRSTTRRSRPRASLPMPVLAIGADKSFGTAMADALRFVASDVTGQVIANSGHWLMEEQPAATVAAITGFLQIASFVSRCLPPPS